MLAMYQKDTHFVTEDFFNEDKVDIYYIDDFCGKIHYARK